MGIFRKKLKPTAVKSYRTYELMPHQIGWTPKWSDFTSRRAIREGYKRSTWVYSCVRLRAANIASVPWKVEVLRGDEWETTINHPLHSLIRRPNPSFDWSSIIRQAVFLMDLSGDSYLSVVRTGAGRVGEIWPLIPDEMRIMSGRDNLISMYQYRKGNIQRNIPAEDIVHLKYTNPGDLYYGLSPLHAAARAVDIDEEAEKWQKVSLQNMGAPPGVISDESIQTQQQYDQLNQWVSDQAGVDNARKPWVLGGTAKWQSMGMNALELDYVNSRKFTREEICSAYSVPPPLVGIYENATLANIQTARQILWREGLIPALNEIQGQLNLQLADEYGEGVRIVYDLSNVEALQENMAERLKNARALWSMGIPFEQINQRLELGFDTEEIPGADVGYLPGGLLPTDFEIGETDQIPGGRSTAQDAGVNDGAGE